MATQALLPQSTRPRTTAPATTTRNLNGSRRRGWQTGSLSLTRGGSASDGSTTVRPSRGRPTASRSERRRTLRRLVLAAARRRRHHLRLHHLEPLGRRDRDGDQRRHQRPARGHRRRDRDHHAHRQDGPHDRVRDHDARPSTTSPRRPRAGVACKRGDRLRVRVFGDDSVDGNMAVGRHVHLLATTARPVPRRRLVPHPHREPDLRQRASRDDGLPDRHGLGGQHRERRPRGVDEPGRGRPDRRHEHGRGLDRADPGHRHGGRHRRRLVHPPAHGLHPRRRGALQHPGARVATPPPTRASASRSPASPATAPARPSGRAGDVSGHELGTTEAAQSFLVSGDDLAISDGQRLRIRVLHRRLRHRAAMARLADRHPLLRGHRAAARRRHLPDLHPDPHRVRRPGRPTPPRPTPTPRCSPTERSAPWRAHLQRRDGQPDDHRRRRDLVTIRAATPFASRASVLRIYRLGAARPTTETSPAARRRAGASRRRPSGPSPRRRPCHSPSACAASAITGGTATRQPRRAPTPAPTARAPSRPIIRGFNNLNGFLWVPTPEERIRHRPDRPSCSSSWHPTTLTGWNAGITFEELN